MLSLPLVRSPPVKLLGKMHKIIAYVHRSNAALTKLNEAQKVHQLRKTTLPKHCPTRWWSTTASVEAFVKNKQAVKLLCEWATEFQQKEKMSNLSDEEWKVCLVHRIIAFSYIVRCRSYLVTKITG